MLRVLVCVCVCVYSSGGFESSLYSMGNSASKKSKKKKNSTLDQRAVSDPPFSPIPNPVSSSKRIPIDVHTRMFARGRITIHRYRETVERAGYSKNNIAASIMRVANRHAFDTITISDDRHICGERENKTRVTLNEAGYAWDIFDEDYLRHMLLYAPGPKETNINYYIAAFVSENMSLNQLRRLAMTLGISDWEIPIHVRQRANRSVHECMTTPDGRQIEGRRSSQCQMTMDEAQGIWVWGDAPLIRKEILGEHYKKILSDPSPPSYEEALADGTHKI